MKLFERTGCLITADGSDDDKIRPQALEPCHTQLASVLNYNPHKRTLQVHLSLSV